MENQIIWSHSRLNTILQNPAEYYWKYVRGISPRDRKAALSLGSAVHWGLENNTDDLSEYYGKTQYTEEQLIAESMVGAYFRRADSIRDAMLTTDTDKATVQDEYHELTLECDVPSYVYKHKFHRFLGIIDLLLQTDKGWILVDYKTSSRDVDWNQYKSQLFKYKMLLEQTFPDIPLFRVAIINIKKCQIRQKKTESPEEYRMRLVDQYKVDDSLIDYHIYDSTEFDDKTLANYVENLSGLIDVAENIISTENWCINYSSIIGLYGESEYAKIFYNDPDAYIMYKIKDKVVDEETGEIVNERPCVPIDFSEENHCLNQYKDFEMKIEEWNIGNVKDKEKLRSRFMSEYTIDNSLFEKYFETYEKIKNQY